MNISRVEVTIDGELINSQGLRRFQENAIEEAVLEEEMDGEDYVDVPEKYGFTLTMTRKSGADRNLRGIRDATIMVQYVSGSRVTFTGCRSLTHTPNEVDGKTGKEVVIVFHAKGRKES